MASIDDDGVRCESCGARLSWRIVRGLAVGPPEQAGEAICPACRRPMEVDADASVATVRDSP